MDLVTFTGEILISNFFVVLCPHRFNCYSLSNLWFRYKIWICQNVFNHVKWFNLKTLKHNLHLIDINRNGVKKYCRIGNENVPMSNAYHHHLNVTIQSSWPFPTPKPYFNSFNLAYFQKKHPLQIQNTTCPFI